MGLMEGEVFRAGEHNALRLPDELDLPLGTRVRFRKDDRGFTVVPIEDPAAVRCDLEQMFVEIDAIWAEAGGPPPAEVRDPDIFPDRPGLY